VLKHNSQILEARAEHALCMFRVGALTFCVISVSPESRATDIPATMRHERIGMDRAMPELIAHALIGGLVLSLPPGRSRLYTAMC
jgi:hypothetical protein